jgi:hypothetical protein
MKNKDVIAILKMFDPEMEVCIFDYKKTLNSTDLNESALDGIYADFDFYEVTGETKDFLAISFDSGEDID